MKTPIELTNDELEDMIDKLEDRIETTQDFLSDADDENTAFVLRQRLILYNKQYQQCQEELKRRKL